MQETTKQNLSIFLIILIFVGGSYFFINYIKPSLEELRDLNRQKARLEQENKYLSEYQKKSEELVKNYSSLGAQLEKINSVIPSFPQTAQILAILNDISKNIGIVLNYVTFSENTVGDRGYITIQTGFTTSYLNIKYWIQEVEKELRVMDIEDISITSLFSEESGSSSGTIIKINPMASATRNTTTTTVPKDKSIFPLLNVSVTIKTYFVK